VVLGNFSYAKMTMVSDLENGTDALVGSDLICAIAGTSLPAGLAGPSPVSPMNEPDLVPPADEFLVLDADASQSYASTPPSAGRPGRGRPARTGKSQTIANLIATLAARGQRVLFVAEKRAAIDAVLDRLTTSVLPTWSWTFTMGLGPSASSPRTWRAPSPMLEYRR